MPEVTIRPTTREDLPLLLAWRQNPLVMRYFVDGGENWEAHFLWWQHRRASSISRMVISGGRPVGEVHCRRQGGKGEVGIYIGEVTVWGKGIGTEAMMVFLEELKRLRRFSCVEASVHPENRRSQRMFLRLGFQFVRVKEDGFLLYMREP